MNSYPKRDTSHDINTIPIVDQVRKSSYADCVRGSKPYLFTFEDQNSNLSDDVFKGEPALIVPDDLAKEGVDLFQFSLIGRLNFKGLSINLVQNCLERQWNLGIGQCNFAPMSRGFFVIKLKSQEAKDHVRHGGRWMIENQVLRVFNFFPNFDPEKQASSKTNIWIHLPGLFIELWTKKILYGLALKLGKPIAIDQKTLDHDFCNYAAILVEVDFAKPIPNRIRVTANGNEFWQPVEIQNKEDYLFCSHCKVLGHVIDKCWADRRGSISHEKMVSKRFSSAESTRGSTKEIWQPVRRKTTQKQVLHSTFISRVDSSSSSNRFTVLNGNYLDVKGNDDDEGSLVGTREVTTRVRVEQVVDQEKSEEKTIKSVQPLKCGEKVVGSLSSSKVNFSESTTKGDEGKDLSMVKANVEESKDGVNQLVDKEITLSGSNLGSKVTKESSLSLARPFSKQEDSSMSKEELKEFNFLKGKEVKDKFKNDQVFRKKWMEREKICASEMRATSEVDVKSLKGGMLEEVENTATTRKVSQVMRSPRLSTEQPKMVTGYCGSSSEARVFLTSEELSELKNITTQKTRDKFSSDAGYRRDWMERNAILDTASSLGGSEIFDSDDDEEDGFIDSNEYVNCDSETLSRALSLGRGRKRFSSKISKGRHRHWG